MVLANVYSSYRNRSLLDFLIWIIFWTGGCPFAFAFWFLFVLVPLSILEYIPSILLDSFWCFHSFLSVINIICLFYSSKFFLVNFWYLPDVSATDSHLLTAGSEIFGIGYSNWDVAVTICRKAMDIGWSLVPVLTGSLTTNLSINILLGSLKNFSKWVIFSCYLLWAFCTHQSYHVKLNYSCLPLNGTKLFLLVLLLIMTSIMQRDVYLITSCQ